MGSLALFKSAQAARVERNPVEVYLAGLSATGRRSMAQKLRIVAPILGDADPRNVPWGSLKFEYLVAIKTWMADNERSPATINATLAALRGTAKAAWSLGLLSSDAYSRIAAVKGLRASRLPSGRALSVGEVAALFDACFDDEKPAGYCQVNGRRCHQAIRAA